MPLFNWSMIERNDFWAGVVVTIVVGVITAYLVFGIEWVRKRLPRVLRTHREYRREWIERAIRAAHTDFSYYGVLVAETSRARGRVFVHLFMASCAVACIFFLMAYTVPIPGRAWARNAAYAVVVVGLVTESLAIWISQLWVSMAEEALQEIRSDRGLPEFI